MKKNLTIIDTNVFIFSIIGQYGYSARIFNELILTGQVKICLSVEVFAEYEQVAKRERFKKYQNFHAKAKELIEQIKEHAIWFEPKERIKFLSDEDDDKFLELAAEAGAGYVVTGNRNHFVFTEFRGIKIYTPQQFYEEWTRLSNNG